jgi:CDP-6-deoxy-D-xylo-4-hexulose-3-dehydrase
VRYLLQNKVELRPLFAGNLVRQPGYRDLPYILVGGTEQADRCMERAFFLPSWNMPQRCMDQLIEILTKYLESW